jgi:hypothetical protein
MKILYLLLVTYAGLIIPCPDVLSRIFVSQDIDTLVYHRKEREAVIIVNTTPSSVFFTCPNDNRIREIERDQVDRIIYGDGRIEVLSPSGIDLIPEDRWRQITLTEDPRDVEEMYVRGPVEVTAPASRNKRMTVRNAEIRLKRQAAFLGADMVLITETQFRGGFRDVPSITMKGIAFGFLPYEEIIE